MSAVIAAAGLSVFGNALHCGQFFRAELLILD